VNVGKETIAVHLENAIRRASPPAASRIDWWDLFLGGILSVLVVICDPHHRIEGDHGVYRR